MRAMVVSGYGEPLAAAEVPEPALRPGTARLQILTCGVCFTDVKTARGRIVAVGYGVDRSLELPSARFVLEEVEVVGSRYVARDELERSSPARWSAGWYSTWRG